MSDIPIDEYEWRENPSGDFIFVVAGVSDIDLYNPNSIYISKNKYGYWNIILASYPFGLVVRAGIYETPEQAMETFEIVFDGERDLTAHYGLGGP